MYAVSYLRQEHSRFRKTLQDISNLSDEKKRLTKFKAFSQDISRHEKMEETIWYPALRKDADMRSIIKHLVSEEKSASKAIKKLLQTDYGILWRLKFMKLKMDINHHAKEEEKQLFPKARKYLDKAELTKLGTAMRKFKSKI